MEQPGEEGCRDEDEDGGEDEAWAAGSAGGSQAPGQVVPARSSSFRVIAHVDLDCFYAQVEMISHPELKDKPLGVQQKSLVVTCNYEARRLGVKKCMSIQAAKEKCPQLVLVNGEDLTRYRETSYKVTELLEEFSPLVERLGFDENFVDLTEMVEKRFQQLRSDELSAVTVSGHVYNQQRIGYKTAKRLEALGIRSVRDLQTFSSEVLEKELGLSAAQKIQKLSFGEDDSLVVPSGPPQSFSEEDSFKKCSSEVEVKKKVEELLASLLNRVSQDGRKPQTVRLAIRRYSCEKYPGRESRQCSVPSHVMQRLGTGHSDVMTPMVDLVMKLFRNMVNVKMPFHLTLLSVCFCNLKEPSASKKGPMDHYLIPSSTAARAGKRRFEAKDIHMEDFSKGKKTKWTFLPSGRLASARTGECPLDSIDVPKEKGASAVPLCSLPEGLDQEVFKQLPRDIQEEILSGKPTENFQGKESLSSPLRKPRGILSYFSTKQMQDGPLKSEDHLSRSRGVSLLSAGEPGTSDFDSRGSSSLSSQKDHHLDVRLNDEQTGPGSEKSQGLLFSNTNSSLAVFPPSPDLPSEQAFPQGHATQSRRQTTPAAPRDEELTENREPETADQSICFPSDVDPQVFHELPEELQAELLAAWKGAGSDP
ncbi:DNA polymerase iota isoform X2 [Ochotona princeps]|uniref:DNA polymerase iota isoform X2 n=1 Tax=Ochotona princeps TaxID=9978 RepID=UPI002715521C|nr:DNA polymerase iota isoform X2 [Ochotona princeps]